MKWVTSPREAPVSLLPLVVLLVLSPRGAWAFEAVHSNQGMTSLPVARIAPGATKIYLDGNLLHTIHYKQFSPYRLCLLIDLSDNRIHVIEDGAFFGVKGLRTLLLARNRLTQLRMEMFAGTGSELQDLHVEQNFIRDIEDGTFTRMANLVELRLHENRLERLRPGMFVGLKSLHILQLLSNKLTCLDSHMFSYLPRPLKVSFYGNPLHCDSSLCWLAEEVTNRGFSWTVDPYCTSGERWDTLDCSNKDNWKTRCPSALDVYIWMIPLVIGVTCIVIILLCCLNRRQIIHCCKSEKQKRHRSRHQPPGPESQRLREQRNVDQRRPDQRANEQQRIVYNVYLDEPGMDQSALSSIPGDQSLARANSSSQSAAAESHLNQSGAGSDLDQPEAELLRLSQSGSISGVHGSQLDSSDGAVSQSPTVPSAPPLSAESTLQPSPPSSTPPPPYMTLPPPSHTYEELG